MKPDIVVSHDTTGQCNTKPQHIYNDKEFILYEIPKGEEEEVFEHRF